MEGGADMCFRVFRQPSAPCVSVGTAVCALSLKICIRLSVCLCVCAHNRKCRNNQLRVCVCMPPCLRVWREQHWAYVWTEVSCRSFPLCGQCRAGGRYDCTSSLSLTHTHTHTQTHTLTHTADSMLPLACGVWRCCLAESNIPMAT